MTDATDLSEPEKLCYAKCQPLSCKHEACYKKWMFFPSDRIERECGQLMKNWKKCFADCKKEKGF